VRGLIGACCDPPFDQIGALGRMRLETRADNLGFGIENVAILA
jgi:hypothetical protein